MKQRIKAFLAGGLLALALFGVAGAGPLEDGLAAYQKGDYAAALQILRPLADQGNADAQFNLGSMYAEGRGVPQDLEQSAIWDLKAADAGNAAAKMVVGFKCFSLGVRYYNGFGVPQDYKRAAVWYRKAADRGTPVAEFALGGMYEKGQGVP